MVRWLSIVTLYVATTTVSYVLAGGAVDTPIRSPSVFGSEGEPMTQVMTQSPSSKTRPVAVGTPQSVSLTLVHEDVSATPQQRVIQLAEESGLRW